MADELLAELDRRLTDTPDDWKRAVLETIGEWPYAAEEHRRRKLIYLIGGEAFDWRLLAERLLERRENGPDIDEWQGWLAEPDIFAGFEEPEFMRLMGVDKSRASLSYFYGVTVEQALVAAVQEEITKRRVASGREPTDSRRDEAYERL